MIINYTFFYKKKSQNLFFYYFIYSYLFIAADFKKIFAQDLEINNYFSNNDNYFILSVENFFYYFIIYFMFTFSITCFYNLIKAKDSIQALTAFFGILTSFIFLFFSIKADYAGSIILMIYLGAIIIFFCFIILTMNPKNFIIYKNSSTINNNSFINVSFAIFAFLYFFVFYYIFREILVDQINLSQNEIFNNVDFWLYNNDTTHVQTIGSILYTYYYIPVNFLGIILFIALVGSLSILNPKNQKKIFFYKKNKYFTRF